jgi:hypothetical protein
MFEDRRNASRGIARVASTLNRREIAPWLNSSGQVGREETSSIGVDGADKRASGDPADRKSTAWSGGLC